VVLEVPPVGDAELAHRVVNVGLNGPHREHEPISDVTVGKPPGRKVDELSLAAGQIRRDLVNAVKPRRWPFGMELVRHRGRAPG
jgi:hypothetical protein